MPHRTEYDLSETAFWIAAARAEREDISKDIYAKHFLDESSKKRFQKYLSHVSKWEDVMLSLRFRFFLDQASEFLGANPDSIFINVASGFTFYPFLLPQGHNYVEIDTPQIISLKRRLDRTLIEEHSAPERVITYIGADLHSSIERKRFWKELSTVAENRSSFVLFEGILYYLDPMTFSDVMKETKQFQVAGSRIGLDTWSYTTKNSAVFEKFIRYASETLNTTEGSFFFNEPNDLNKISGYASVVQSTYKDVAESIDLEFPAPSDEVLWEDLTVLERRI